MTDLQSIRTTRKIVRQELLEHFSDQEIEAEHSRRVLRKFDAWTVIGRRDSHWKSQGSHKIDCPQMSRKKSHARNAANLCPPQKPFAYRDQFKATYQFDVAVCLRRETERVRTSVPAEHFPVIQPQRSAIKQYIRRVFDRHPSTRFSGPDNIIYFFMHDFVSLTNFPDRPEAGTGFIDRIQVTTFPAEVPASPGVDFLASSSWRALAFSAGGDGGRN